MTAFYMIELTKTEKEEICSRFAEYLPELRKMMKLTQSKLGEICGYSRIRISNIETGREALSWHQLMAIAFICYMNAEVRGIMERHEILDDSFFKYISR